MYEPSEPVTRLRPPDLANPMDEAFLVRLYASTRAAELDMVPWTDAQKEYFARLQATAQRQHYRAEYPTAEEFLILLDETRAGVDETLVGRLYIDRRDAEIRLLDFSLLPDFYTGDVGPQTLAPWLQESAATGKPLTIHMQPDDPLQNLFERLGFALVSDNGVHRLFEWRAS